MDPIRERNATRLSPTCSRQPRRSPPRRTSTTISSPTLSGRPRCRPPAWCTRTAPSSCLSSAASPGLEPKAVADLDGDPAWSWWEWIRNYRVWEVGRKVFVEAQYYLRPEWRDDKTEPSSASRTRCSRGGRPGQFPRPSRVTSTARPDRLSRRAGDLLRLRHAEPARLRAHEGRRTARAISIASCSANASGRHGRRSISTCRRAPDRASSATGGCTSRGRLHEKGDDQQYATYPEPGVGPCRRRSAGPRSASR